MDRTLLNLFDDLTEFYRTKAMIDKEIRWNGQTYPLWKALQDVEKDIDVVWKKIKKITGDRY